MAKGIYVNIGNAAKKAKNIYIGTSAGTKRARRVFCNVNGAIKLVYVSMVSKQIITTATSSRTKMAHDLFNGVAIFAGGLGSDSYTRSSVVETFNFTTLAKTIISSGLNVAKTTEGISTNNNFFVGGGADSSSNPLSSGEVYDKNYVKSNITITAAKDRNVFKYNNSAFFVSGGTQSSGYYNTNVVDIFDDNRTRSSFNAPFTNSTSAKGTLGDKAVLIGGSNVNGMSSNNFTVLNMNTKASHSASNLNFSSYSGSSVLVGGRLVFAGFPASTKVVSVDSNLVVSYLTSLDSNISEAVGVTLGDEGYFIGGFNNGSSDPLKSLIYYDKNIVRQVDEVTLDYGKYSISSVVNGSKALLYGGSGNQTIHGYLIER